MAENIDRVVDGRRITLRPATGEDEDFLRCVYATTREVEMAIVPWDEGQKSAFLDMQFRAQHTFYHAEFPDANYDVIEHDGVGVGRLYVDRRSSDIRILDIAILPDSRNGGVGTFLIREIMAEAAAANKTVSLHVETFNPARRLYDRLGFLPIGDDGLYVLMEWKHNHDTS